MSVLVAKAKQQVFSCITAAADAAIKNGELEKAELNEFRFRHPQAGNTAIMRRTPLWFGQKAFTKRRDRLRRF